jgi:hypothetical protein
LFRVRQAGRQAVFVAVRSFKKLNPKYELWQSQHHQLLQIFCMIVYTSALVDTKSFWDFKGWFELLPPKYEPL